MDNYKGTGKVDPDYESYNSAVELNQEEDKKENLIKLRKIIEEEYNKEIFQRQEQIEQIEMQICKVRKLLHLLRYVLVMSYYKRKELEYSGTEDETSTIESLVIPDKQSRIHPALKKLLGKNVNNLDHLHLKNKRKSITRHTNITQLPPNSPDNKKIKLDPDLVETPEKIIPEVPHKNHQNNFESIRSRKKTKYRIVVGNISKWMPLSEDDVLTHKWLVYVRGPKEKPDVSHFIDKVVYYLHPSYKPHDVVEVSESPFHLARRGWGEFPVRVQIFFKVKLNKPIDIVHNIKLDKTYSGRQTLGNETIVDVFLYEDAEFSPEYELEEVNFQGILEDHEIKIEEIDLQELIAANVEHDYCTEINDEKTEDEGLSRDHSYCLSEGLPKPKKEKIEQDETNNLIYGLDTYYRDPNTEESSKLVKTPNHFKQLIQLNRKDIKFSNTKIIVFGKKIEGSFLTNFNKLLQTPPSNKPEANNSPKVTLPTNRFKSIGEALPYLFKRLPLCTESANSMIYKRTYPFTASSLKEYSNWNVGKRRSSEWSRARAIKSILSTEKIPGIEKWTTKSILMYGRSHEYSPFVSEGLFRRESDEKQLLLSCYADARTITRTRIVPEDDPINVDSDTDVASPKKSHPVIDVSDPHLKMECSYIRQTALDCGVILKPEEIIEGVKINGAEMMILEAVKCLAENLIRRAKNHRVCTRTLSPTSADFVSKEDVEVAIHERPEMFCLQQFRNERRNAEYFS